MYIYSEVCPIKVNEAFFQVSIARIAALVYQALASPLQDS